MRSRGIDRGDGLARHARPREVRDDETWTSLSAHGNDREIRHVAIGDGELGAAQLRRRTATRSACGISRTWSLGHGQRADDFACCQLWQVLPASAHRCRSAGSPRSPDRLRRRTAPGATAWPSSSASTQTARWPRPAPPNSSGIAAPVQPISAIACHSGAIVWLRAFQDAARHAGRTAFGQEPPRLVAELLEFVREVEVHAGRPPRNDSTARLKAAGWCRFDAWPASWITTLAAPGIFRAM